MEHLTLTTAAGIAYITVELWSRTYILHFQMRKKREAFSLKNKRLEIDKRKRLKKCPALTKESQLKTLNFSQGQPKHLIWDGGR